MRMPVLGLGWGSVACEESVLDVDARKVLLEEDAIH